MEGSSSKSKNVFLKNLLDVIINDNIYLINIDIRFVILSQRSHQLFVFIIVDFTRIIIIRMQSEIKDKQRLFSKLFISATYTQKLQPPLVVAPSFLNLILNQAAHTTLKYQKDIINQILDLYVRRPLNSLLLYNLDIFSQEVQSSVLDNMVLWMLRTVSIQNQVNQFLEKLRYMVIYYQTSLKNISKLTQWLSIAFYQQKFNKVKLSFIIGVLNIYLRDRKIIQENPWNFFYIFGGQNNSSLKTLSNLHDCSIKNTLFVSLCFNNMTTFCYNNHNLFLLTTNLGESFQACVHKNQLILGYKLQSNHQTVTFAIKQQILQNIWYRLVIQYTAASTIVKIDNRQHRIKTMLGKNKERTVKQCIFGENFHGMMTSIILSSKIPANDQFSYDNYPYGYQSWQCLEKLKRSTQFTENIFLSCFPFSVFQLRYQWYCFDVFKRNHCSLGDNIVTYKSQTKQSNTLKFGGIKTIIPLFYLAKLYNVVTYPTLVQELLDLILSILKSNNKEEIQQQISKDNIILILSHHLSECWRFITSKCLQKIQQIDSYFQSQINCKSSIKHLLWGFNISQISSKQIINQHYTYIYKKYTQNMSFAQSVFGMADIVYHMVKNFQDNSSCCCIKHYINQSVLSEQFCMDNAIKIKLMTFDIHFRWFQSIILPNIRNSWVYNRNSLKKINKFCYSIDQNFASPLTAQILDLSIFDFTKNIISTVLQILQKQIFIFKDNKKFLLVLSEKCDTLSFLAFLSQKTIDCDLLTQIIYIILATYFGLEGQNDERIKIVRCLKGLFARFSHFPKNQKHIFKNTAKRIRKNSQDIINNKTDISPSIIRINTNEERYSPQLNKQQEKLKQMMQILRLSPSNINSWQKLYIILRNFTVSILSDCAETAQINSKVVTDENSLQILIYYFRVVGANIRQLIVKDLLQHLMINKQNVTFYRQSYWLNLLLVQAISNFDSGILSEMSLKVINNIFQITSRDGKNIRQYYILLKAILLLNKEMTVQLLYCVFSDLLARRVLKMESICSLLLIVHFQIQQSKVQFVQLTSLSIQIVQNLTQILQKHFLNIYKYQICLEEDPIILQSAIELLLCMHSQKNILPHFIFQGLIQNLISESQITFVFDSFLSKILTNSQYSTDKMIKSTYFLEIYISIIGKLLILAHKNKNEDNKEQENMMENRPSKKYQHYKYKTFKFDKNFERVWSNKLVRVLIYYASCQMCKQNTSNNQITRMVIYQASYILLQIQQYHNFTKLWGFIVKIMVHFSKDPEIKDYDSLTQRMNDVVINPVFVEMFKYFVKKNDMTPLLNVEEMKLLQNDLLIQKFVQSEQFRQSLMMQNKINDLLIFCEQKNNQFSKQYFLTKISVMQISLKKQKQKQLQMLKKQSNIQHLFDEQNILEEDVRIKFLHEQERQLRKYHFIWKGMWDNFRIYHKPYSFWMAQKDTEDVQFPANKLRNYKFVMSKYSTTTGITPILEAKIKQPWHIIKVESKEKFKYGISFSDLMVPKGSPKKKTQNSLMGIKNLWNIVWKGEKNQVKQSKQYEVVWIKQSIKAKGKLFLKNDQIIFYYDGVQQQDTHLSFEKFSLPFYKLTYEIWRLPTILKITKKRYLLKYSALQIYLNTGRNILLNFENNDFETFLDEIKSFRQTQIYHYANRIKSNNVSFYMQNWLGGIGLDQSITEAWVNNKISNLQYLIEVNKAGSRSIEDLSQYFVAPWVVEMWEEYQPTLRDLSKTMGALGSEQRKQLVIEKYSAKDPFNPVPPFFYGTHYSSPGVIFNFLIRIAPFTQYCKHLQGGKFDIADRLFSSFIASWRSSSTEVSDVRELIPQFYYLPQALINIQNHNLGVTQCGQVVNNIDTPSWAKNPYQFVIKMREILQSPKVSQNLNKWIDLIFGYKQKGKQAQQNLNVYYYLTYEQYGNLQNSQDQIHKKSCQAQIVHFGQIPPMIFSKPHPYRNIKKSSSVSIAIIQKIKLINSFKEKIVGIQIVGSEMRIVKRNIIDTLSINREPAVLQKSVKFDFEKSSNEIYYICKKQFSRVVFFKTYILCYGYLNNQMRIFTRSTGMIEQSAQLQSEITFVYVNEASNLILVGCSSGILHIYEVQYDDKRIYINHVAEEVFPAPIYHISERQSFFAISFGNYVGIYKIVRSLHYMSKKYNSQVFIKFFRSFKTNIVVRYSFIINSPLYGIVICDNASMKIFSINGQLIKNISLNTKYVGILKNQYLHDMIYYVENNKAFLVSTPYLKPVSQIFLGDYEQIFDNYLIYKNQIEVLGCEQIIHK